MTLSVSEFLVGIVVVAALILVEALLTRLVEATRPARPATRKIQAPHHCLSPRGGVRMSASAFELLILPICRAAVSNSTRGSIMRPMGSHPYNGQGPVAPSRACIVGIRILVVEDEELIAASLVRGLREEGFTVEHAPDGGAAWSALQSG